MKRRRSSPTPSRAARALITTVIFDLDDTLYNCLEQRVKAAHRHAARAMVRAGLRATVEEVFRARMRAFARDPQLEAIDAAVCRRFKVTDPERMGRLARDAFYATPVGRLRLFPGVRPLLRKLRRAGVRLFLVSFGNPATQRAKVASLGLDREPALERILYADTNGVLTKEDAFRRVLAITGADAKRVLVVGDRPNGEIAAGNRLGMHTVRIQGGEFARLRPRGREERAHFQLRRVTDLLRLPFAFGT